MRRERARLAEMHSSSPHRFAVSSFTHGSGGKKQTHRNRSARNQFSPESCKRGKRAGKMSFKGSRLSPEERRDAEGESDASVERRCDDRANSGQWRAFYLQKCRKSSRAEGGPETISSTRSASVPTSVYRDITGKISTAGSPRGSISPLAREGNDRGSTERSVGGHRTRMPVQGDCFRCLR